MIIISYIKWIDAYTTHLIHLDREVGQELCTIDGVTYCSVSELPEPLADVPYTVVTLTDELTNQIKAACPQIQRINAQVQAKIAEKYSMADEIKLLRKGKTTEFDEYNTYVETCVAEGQAKKAALGL